MNLYNVKNNYIQYLRKFDSKISENKFESRPYVGIVLDVNGIKYYAPLSSPKLKYIKMKNKEDFRKINQGEYGAINFNNMIPIVEEALIPIDFKSIKDRKYRRLLQNQYKSIRSDKEFIQNTALKLHNLLLTPDNELNKHKLIVKQRCCNLALLESIYKNYKSLD